MLSGVAFSIFIQQQPPFTDTEQNILSFCVLFIEKMDIIGSNHFQA